MRHAEHEWFVLFFTCSLSLLWLCIAFVLLWDHSLGIAAADPISWARAVLAVPLWVAVVVGTGLYANHIGVDPLVLGFAVALSIGVPLGLLMIAWLRRSGV